MAARFNSVDHDTALLLPPDLRDWVPEDHMVNFVSREPQPPKEGPRGTDQYNFTDPASASSKRRWGCCAPPHGLHPFAALRGCLSAGGLAPLGSGSSYCADFPKCSWNGPL